MWDIYNQELLIKSKYQKKLHSNVYNLVPEEQKKRVYDLVKILFITEL